MSVFQSKASKEDKELIKNVLTALIVSISTTIILRSILPPAHVIINDGKY